MPAILQAEKITKKYGSVEVVHGLSFQVEEGEVFGLLGPNGAGKTTSISMLTGLFPPTSGSAMIGGYDIQKEPLRPSRSPGWCRRTWRFTPP